MLSTMGQQWFRRSILKGSSFSISGIGGECLGEYRQLLTSFPTAFPYATSFYSSIRPFDKNVWSFSYMSDIVLSAGSKAKYHSNSNIHQPPSIPPPENVSWSQPSKSSLTITTQSDCAKTGVRIKTGFCGGIWWG